MATIAATEVSTGVTGLRTVRYSGINPFTTDTCDPLFIANASDITICCAVTGASAGGAWVWEISPDGTTYFNLATTTNGSITPTALTGASSSIGIPVGSRGLYFRFRCTAGAAGASATLLIHWRQAT